jgi:hypothetical protein
VESRIEIEEEGGGGRKGEERGGGGRGGEGRGVRTRRRKKEAEGDY